MGIGKVDEIIERRVLIDAPTIWTPRALPHLKIPDFGRCSCIQIQLILTRARIAPFLSRWLLKAAVLPVVKHQDVLIKGDRDRVLTDRRQAAGREGERISPQRRKPVPLFGRISEDPLNRSCLIVEADEKIFTARNDQRVIGSIVGNGVVMKPIGWRMINELGGIVSPWPSSLQKKRRPASIPSKRCPKRPPQCSPIL